MRHLTPLLLLLSALPAAPADDVKASAPGGKSPAAALVNQLGDPDFRTREAAGKKLLDLRERAVSALEAGLESPVPEVASRCETLLAAVKHNIDADAVLTPTMVELPDGEQTVQKAFDSLLRQNGYAMRVEGDQAVLADKVKVSGGVMTYWEAVLAVCAAAKLEVHSVDPNAGLPGTAKAPGTVVLRAATEGKRWTAHKALLVQVSAPTKDELAAYPTTQCPLIVRVFPEPRVKWHRFVEAEVAKAADAKGNSLGPALPEPPRLDLREEMLLSSRPIARDPRPDGNTWGTLKLAVPPDGPTDVATLAGSLRFTAWKPAEQIAVVRLKDGETEGTADGPHGTRLSVKVVGPISNEPGSTILKVTHRWNPERVRVQQGGAAGDAVWFENVNGRVVPVKPTPADRGAKPNASGTVVTNAAGEPLTLNAGNTRFDAVADKGVMYSSMTVEYVARQGDLTDAKPAAVTLHAARVTEVVVPFSVKDLPLAAGTGTAIERRMYKR